MYVTTSSGYGSCTAHITTNRNRVKLYGNQVYLKDKQKFEIELFNPNTINYLAKISINGSPISSSGIVVKPGQRIYLERFIETNNKFVFETYEIEKSNKALNAVVNNGLVEISFFPEQTTFYPYSGTITVNTTDNILNTGTGTFSPFGGTTISTLTAAIGNTTSNSINTSYFSNIETGKVEKGESSNQDLNHIYGSYSYISSNIVSYRLVPESQKPVEVEKLRNYCTGCGNRIRKSTWKFCPSCGEKF